MRRDALRWTAAALVSASVTGALSRPGEAAPSPQSGALVMTAFVQRGRTDVRRNEVLEFRFSTKLRKASVSDRTLQVNALTPAGRVPAIGARIVQGHVVRFDPSRSQRNFDASIQPNTTVTETDNFRGLAALQSYEVLLPAKRSGLSLRSRSGRRLAKGVSTTFATNEAYFDPFPGQPLFVGDHGTGLLGFDPPRHAATGDWDDDASLVLEFSEPILVSSLDLASTVLVTVGPSGATVPGSIRAAPGDQGGRRFLFDPTGGWAAAIAQAGGGTLRLELTTGITDLAGNPLKRPVTPSADAAKRRIRG